MTPTVGENVERARRAVRLAAELTSTARQCTAQAHARVTALHKHMADAAAAGAPQAFSDRAASSRADMTNCAAAADATTPEPMPYRREACRVPVFGQ